MRLNLTTTIIQGTIALPTGVSVSPTVLTVSSSVGTATPDATLRYSLEAFSGTPQLAIVTTTAGNPLLLGFVDSTHTTIDTASSAVALLYFALGMPLLPAEAQLQGLRDLQSWNGTAPLAAAITSTLAANADAFGAATPDLLGALQSAVAAAEAGIATDGGLADGASTDSASTDSASTNVASNDSAPGDVVASGDGADSNVDGDDGPADTASDGATSRSARLAPRDGGMQIGVLTSALSIDVPTPQSGVTVVPDGPYTLHLKNASRRRAWAYVDQVSTTDSNGVVTMMPKLDPMGFEVVPEDGATSGLLGGLTDLIDAFWGNKPLYYTPKDSPTPPASVPLAPGSVKTAYQVTLVGAGLHLGVSPQLSKSRLAQLATIAAKGYYLDLIQPVLLNVVFGAGIDYGTVSKGSFATQLEGLLQNIYTDLLGVVQGDQMLANAIGSGDWKTAASLMWTDISMWNTVATSNTLRDAIDRLFGFAANLGVQGPTRLVAATAFTAFNTLCNRLGGMIQIFDVAKLQYDIADADLADQWTVNVDNSPVTITPPSNQVSAKDTVPLTASIEAVTDLSMFTFHWHNTGNGGHLVATDSGAQMGNDFCASSPTVNYVAETNGKTDTITVEAWQGTMPATGPMVFGCKAPAVSFGTGQASVLVGIPAVVETLVASPMEGAAGQCSGAIQPQSQGQLFAPVVYNFPFYSTSNPPTPNVQYFSPNSPNNPHSGDGVILGNNTLTPGGTLGGFRLDFPTPPGPGTYSNCLLSDSSILGDELTNHNFLGSVVFPSSCSVTFTSFGTNVGDIVAGSFTGTLWAVSLGCWEADTCSPPIPSCPPSATVSGTFFLPVPSAALSCTPGNTQCSATTAMQTCSSSGQWVNTTTCPNGCFGTTCAACAPETTQCSGDELQQCQLNGLPAAWKWIQKTVCSSGCANGACQ